MASSSTNTGKTKILPDSTDDDEHTEVEDMEEDEDLEHFDDFTLASSWERFISEIEAVCRLWMSDGPKNLMVKGAVLLEYSGNLYKVTSETKYALKTYSMEYYFETNPSDDAGKPANWNLDLHDLQLCFGVKEFLVIAPQSASGVVLDAPEASKLLSAVAIALSNCSSLWPAFVPVHDPSRKAYIGIQSMGTVFTRRFEADRIGSQVPIKLMHLEGLYELFVSKFAYSTLDLSVHNFKVRIAMKLTFRTLPFDEDYMKDFDSKINKSEENLTGETSSGTQWDDDCSWSEWYSAEDPVKGFELITIWSEKMVESSMEMAELENASPHEAEKWLTSLRKPEVTDLYKDKKSSDLTRRGSVGIVDSMMLLKSYQIMHAPYTQEPPLMIEDMHEERMQAVEAISDSFTLCRISRLVSCLWMFG